MSDVKKHKEEAQKNKKNLKRPKDPKQQKVNNPYQIINDPGVPDHHKPE